MDGHSIVNESKFRDTTQLIRETENCTICGTKVDFTHYVDYGTHNVRENARCPECGVSFQQTEHKLQ